MSELALDDVDRDNLARESDRVDMAGVDRGVAREADRASPWAYRLRSASSSATLSAFSASA